MKNNGLIFRGRCIAFVSKLNIYQLTVLKELVNDKINKLNRKGLIKDEILGQKIKK